MTAKSFIMTDNTQPRYYVLKPVSEKPEKDGPQIVLRIIDNKMESIDFSDFENGKLHTMAARTYTHYLSPVTEDSLLSNITDLQNRLGAALDEVERLRGLLWQAHTHGYQIADENELSLREGFDKFKEQHNL